MKNEVNKLVKKINMQGLHGQLSTVDDCFFCVGDVFYQQKLLTTGALYQLVVTAFLADSLNELLLQLSGFYSFVFIDKDRVVSAVDRIRSRPLFYALQNNTLYLSDSAPWIVEQLEATKVNLLAEKELQQAGYVSGENTLIEELLQIPAGSLLVLSENFYRIQNYYRFVPSNNNQEVSQADLYSELDQAMKESITQLIAYANGRQLVVPLSGGYDSRAIVLYLKELNYTNVLTFTFGKSSSEEVVISKQVADALDFKWHFVEYNRKLWRSMSSTNYFNDFLSFISSFVSVPNVQVFPALKYLTDNNIISPDAILVPGHTGDFVSGGHIPRQLLNLPAQGNTHSIVKAIIARHYKSKSKIDLTKELEEKLSIQVDYLQQNIPEALPAVSLFEAWEYNERQAKFIVNSNRYYDFFNLDWWMPLWHNSVTGFWVEAPLVSRLGSTLWQDFLQYKYQQVTGQELSYGNVDDKYSPKVLRLRVIFDYFTDANCLYALVPFYRWFLRKLKYPYANGTVFSYLSAKMIKRQKDIINK